ncbi:MAG: hypothetical protein K6E24_02805 [bacterium]|nr:hypothetical protein [bacterium]
MSGSMLVLGAVALIALLVGFGFLLGFLRGFRKSLYFTIIFIVVIVISFIFATALAKSVYSGSTLWKFAKGALPSSMTEGAEGVNSLKEFVRFFITKNYTEVLESGITAGESIVANENAMGIVDGLIVMILKIVMLIGSYLILTVTFYIVFGLIYILFLRPKTYIETETTTDEDGNETVEEREVKAKKRRLSGGLIGGVKGFVKAMIILIPISFAIGMIAQIEIPTNSSASITDARLADSSKASSTLKDIVDACKSYDSSIGKMYFGLDDAIMDKLISYDVKGADGKKVKVVLRKEVSGFIDIYNTIEKEIGMDNIKDYDFKNNLNSSEMKAIVASITENLSESKATTTLLTAVGDEASVIIKDKASKNDADMALLFEEIDLKNKDNKWWQEQIAQLNDIYNAFADMKLDFTKASSKEYNLMFAETTSTDFEHFVDEVFNNELMEMVISGGIKYAVKKLPDNLSEVENTATQVVLDKEVEQELKAFSKLIDVIKNDLTFNNGSIDMNQIKFKTLSNIVDTNILNDSKLVSKATKVLLKNAFGEDSGLDIDFNKFDDPTFSIHDECKYLSEVIIAGFGSETTTSELKDFADSANIGQICDVLDCPSLPKTIIADGLFSSILPMVAKFVAPTETFDDIDWSNEYDNLSVLLKEIYTRDTKYSELTDLNFDTIKLRQIDNLSKNNDIWQDVAVPRMFKGIVSKFTNGLIINGESVTVTYDESKVNWQNELKSLVQLGLYASDTNEDITDDYDNQVNVLVNAFNNSVKVKLLDVLGNEIQTDKEFLHSFANATLKKMLGENVSDAKYECKALANVANILDDNTSDSYLGYGSIELSTVGDKVSEALPEMQFKALTNSLALNIKESKYLQSNVENKIAVSVDKSSWNGDKWEIEMTAVDNVAQEMDPDSEGNIAMGSINESMNEVKDAMLVELQENTPYSEILQDVFAETLVNNTLIDNKSDITDWELEMDGLITVARTMETDGKLKMSELNEILIIRVRTVDSLEDNTHKSIVLMNTMTKNLSEPMSTPNMSSWARDKWQREMPRIGEVLKTLASDPTDFDDAITISEVNMGEDSEIKRVTFERIEDNIAYSEALQNMFKNAMKDVEEPDKTVNPYDFPDPEIITGDTLYSAWWDAEITGLVNVIYTEMELEEKDTVKLSEFSETEGTKAKVVKSLSNESYYYRNDGENPMVIVLKVKVYSTTFSQRTNIGVSEYLQYMFKPNFRDLSKNGVAPDYRYFEYTDTYNWDNEFVKIMNVFLTTQMKYEDEHLRDIYDNEEITFEDDVTFRLLNAEDTASHTNKEAAERNKAVLDAISENISENTYLQYVLAPEMKKMMLNGRKPGDYDYEELAKYISKDPTTISGNETGWTNSEWVNETDLLNQMAQLLITEESPKMEGIDFYQLDQTTVELICDITPQSYLLQSKMAKPFIDAGINNSAITSVESLIGTEISLMEYIVKYEWNDGKNEAYEAVMETLNAKREELKQMKNASYDVVGLNCKFFDSVNNTIVEISSETGLVTDKNGNAFLTDSVDTKLDAIKTYAEYAMMHKSLSDNASEHPEDERLPQMVSKLAYRCNNEFIYSE